MTPTDGWLGALLHWAYHINDISHPKLVAPVAASQDSCSFLKKFLHTASDSTLQDAVSFQYRHGDMAQSQHNCSLESSYSLRIWGCWTSDREIHTFLTPPSERQNTCSHRGNPTWQWDIPNKLHRSDQIHNPSRNTSHPCCEKVVHFQNRCNPCSRLPIVQPCEMLMHFAGPVLWILQSLRQFLQAVGPIGPMGPMSVRWLGARKPATIAPEQFYVYDDLIMDAYIDGYTCPFYDIWRIWRT